MGELRSLPMGQHALAVIVVTDGVGCVARIADDRDHTLSLIKRDLQLMRDLCQQFAGRVLRSLNDGLVLYFVDPVKAVGCAVEIQKQLAKGALGLPATDVLTHRIGIHLGDVLISETDVAGNGVNVATRLQAEASPMGVCLSQAVYDVVKNRLNLEASYLGSFQLKSTQELVPAYQIFPATQLAADRMEVLEDAELPMGTMVNNRYRIERVLGQGGFGRTYLASDVHSFGDLCVLKEFVPANRTQYFVQKARELFEREAKVLYQLDHPQIPKFLAWLSDKSRLFLVQEYIDGKTYAAILRDRQQLEAALSEAEVVQWLIDVLPVLDYLHKHDIVHRDVSPENIMLPNGSSLPVLIDFGLVKQTASQIFADPSANASAYTDQASVVGKFGYSPPEQIRMGYCSPSGDLYSLGVSAVVLLTGREPNLLINQGSLEWRWHPYVTIHDRLIQVLDKLLAEKPKDRYQSAEAVLADLRSLNSGSTESHESTLEIRIEIDQEKRSRQVAEILQSEYFQRLQSEVDSFWGDVEVWGDVEDSEGTSELSLRPQVNPANPDPGHDLVEPRLEPELPAVQSQLRSTANLSQDFLQQCERQVALRIGPIARHMIKQILAQAPTCTPLQLVDRLASQISDPRKALEFREAIAPALESVPPEPTAPAPPPSTLVAAPSSAATATLDPALVERCHQELTRFIGPIAGLVLKEVLAKHPNSTPQQLVEELATRISNPQQGQVFKQQLQKFFNQ